MNKNTKLDLTNLQIFADKLVPETDNVWIPDEIVDLDTTEDDVTENTDNTDDITEETDVDDAVDEEVEEVVEEEPFLKIKDQAELDNMFKDRLARQEKKFLNDCSSEAGTALTMEDIKKSSNLWGLLSYNPELAEEVEKLIVDSIKEGSAKLQPKGNVKGIDPEITSREQEIVKKEAIFELKQADATFALHHAKILAWGEKEGYAVKDPKSLKQLYWAWKGLQTEIKNKSVAVNKQKTVQTKKQQADGANVQGGNSSKGSAIIKDVKDMTEKEFLKANGLSLFTDD